MKVAGAADLVSSEAGTNIPTPFCPVIILHCFLPPT